MTASSVPKIGTHDGAFHCDEVLACHMLRTLSKYEQSPIIRTRDVSILQTMDVVVDVGGVYDVSSLRYDHHQRTFEDTFATEGPRSSIRLSSAGLVYKHHGRDIIRKVLDREKIKVRESDIEKIYLKVYDSFVEAVDAIDNGVQQFESDKPARYSSSTDLSSRVARLNAEWWERDADQDANFLKAVVMAGRELDECIVHVARSWLPARAIVANAMKTRQEDEESGKVLVMRDWAPWKEHLYDLEREHDVVGQLLYVVYKDMMGKTWRVQCVPVEKASFTSRKPLPAKWRGIRDEQLSNLTGIPNCVFVHAAGFIGGNLDFQGVMQMTRKALEEK